MTDPERRLIAGTGILPVKDRSGLAACLWDARHRTLSLVADLSDDQLLGPRLDIVNPLLWEIGHVAWFQEKWVLRHVGERKPLRRDVDSLYDSSAIAHDTRWALSLPSREETLRYIRDVCDEVLQRLQQWEPTDHEKYFILLSLYHEDMHTEALTYTRQTLGYPTPYFGWGPPSGEEPQALGPPCSNQYVEGGSGKSGGDGALPGDAESPGGTFRLGAYRKEPFVFDNEKWAHPVTVKPFAIARAPVTQSEFAAFVDDNGYRRREVWSRQGWCWRKSVRAGHPLYWRRTVKQGWQRRRFGEWIPLEPHKPVIHVNWYEAQAYCRWAHRRLPTELEWEVAAAAEPALDGGSLSLRKWRFPWGDEPPNSQRANTDWRHMDCLDVGALPESDSPLGCRQMIGNVWEWTDSDFLPYPDFSPDEYREYSVPWFNTHKVLRGGSWATRARLIRNTWRNFYRPHRRDVLAGFRTCALER